MTHTILLNVHIHQLKGFLGCRMWIDSIGEVGHLEAAVFHAPLSFVFFTFAAKQESSLRLS